MKKFSFEDLGIKISDTRDAIRGKDIFYKCNICQSIIPSIPKGNIGCTCHNINIDKDMNRMFVEDFSNFLILKKVPSKDKPST